MQSKQEDRIGPVDVAAALRASLEADLREPDPSSHRDALDLARWGRDMGLVEPAMRAALSIPASEAIPLEDMAWWLRTTWAPRLGVSPHPDRWEKLLDGTREIKRRFLERRAERMEACGSVWWSNYVVRLFWKDRHGRERLRRQIGVHRCKCAWCPVCGRSRQAQLSAEIEKMLTLLADFGLDAGHARLVTLTSPNGADVLELKLATHEAFAKLQRSRWWNRHVFGFVRGSEVKTGEDGKWNFHIHLVVVFWSDRVSYEQIGRAWDRELASVVGARGDGKRFVVDVEELEAKRWHRKDGKAGPLKRKGSLARAARYITKYLTKGEELRNLRRGPGGLAHLELATRRMRRFGMGGGCSLVRRASKVLMPGQLFQAEEHVNGARLKDGRAPWRAELLDPSTGEVRSIAHEAPLQDEHGAGLAAWGRALASEDVKAPARWKLPPIVVGQPCGPSGRYRKLGSMPLNGRGVTVGDFETAWRAWMKRRYGEMDGPERIRIVKRRRGQPQLLRVAVRTPALGRMPGVQTGLRGLVAEGRWKVFRWAEHSNKSGKLLRFACVLPALRFSWRPVWEALKEAMKEGPWALLRKRAGQAGAAASITPDLASISHKRSIRDALDDSITARNHRGEAYQTTKREELGEELMSHAVRALLNDPRAAWDDAVQRAWKYGQALQGPGLLPKHTAAPFPISLL